MALAAALVLIAGCQSQKWSGQYEGERTGIVQPGKDDDIAATLKRIKLTIWPSGKFEIVDLSLTKTGTIRSIDGGIELVVKKKMDRNAPEGEPGYLAFPTEGGLMLRDQSGLSQSPITLNRTGDAPVISE